MQVRVKINEMRRISADILDLSSAAKSIDDTITSVRQSLANTSEAYNSICSNLNKVQEKVTSAVGSITSVGRVLNTIADNYNSIENEITENGEGIKHSLTDVVSSKWLKNAIAAWENAISLLPGTNVTGMAQGLALSTIIGQLIGNSDGTHQSLVELFQSNHQVQSDASLYDEDGNLNPNLHLLASGDFTALQLSDSFSAGMLSGAAVLSVGAVEAMGSVDASIFDENGKLSPKLNAKAHAEATALEGSAQTKFGSDENNVHASAEGKVLSAEADASVNISSEGVQAKVGAEAYLAQGSVKGGINILGIQIDIEGSGSIGASATASASITGTSVSGEIGACLGIGAGIQFSIDWSGFKNPFDYLFGNGD